MDLFYREFGKGRHIIILHGLFGSSDNWKTLAKKFAHHFHVITVDQRNHGQSFHHEDLNYDVMGKDLERLYSRLNIEKAVLIGHSMGGKKAMKFTLENPDRVDKLVVVDIAPRHYPVHHDAIIDALCDLNVDQYKKRQEADKALSKKIENKAVRQFLLKNLDRSKEGHLIWKINLPAIKKNLENIGKEIQSDNSSSVPALFIAGKKSNYIQPPDESHIRQLFLNSNITYFENASHWIHAEAPEEFYKTVINFLKP